MERRTKSGLYTGQRSILRLSAHARYERRISAPSLPFGGDERALFQAHDSPLSLWYDLRHTCAALLGDYDVPLGHQFERDAFGDARSAYSASYDRDLDAA